MQRQRAKVRKIAAAYIASEGRPRKKAASEEAKRNNEVAHLRTQVELLRNFLYEAERRGSGNTV